MKKISSELENIISRNDFLAFGFYNHIFNLSKLTILLKPVLEARIKKKITTSSILMNLSRLQNKFNKRKVIIDQLLPLKLKNISMHSNLCSFTYFETKKLNAELRECYSEISKNDNYVSIITGLNEISLIVEESNMDTVNRIVKEKPKNIHKNLASVDIRLAPETYNKPGTLHRLFQQIAFQGINIFGVSSSFNDMSFYVEQKELKLAFETMFEFNIQAPMAEIVIK